MFKFGRPLLCSLSLLEVALGGTIAEWVGSLNVWSILEGCGNPPGGSMLPDLGGTTPPAIRWWCADGLDVGGYTWAILSGNLKKRVKLEHSVETRQIYYHVPLSIGRRSRHGACIRLSHGNGVRAVHAHGRVVPVKGLRRRQRLIGTCRHVILFTYDVLYRSWGWWGIVHSNVVHVHSLHCGAIKFT